MIATFVKLLLRFRYLALGLIVASCVVSNLALTKIHIRFQFSDFYDYPGNSDMPLFREYTSEFGDPAGYVVLLLQTDDVFRARTLRYVAELDRALAPNPLFSSVRSVATVSVIRGVDGNVENGPLMPRVPETPEAMATLRRVAMGSDLIRRRLVSEDSTLTTVLAEMRTPATLAGIDEQARAVAAVREVLAHNPPPPDVKVSITGAPTVEVETTDALIKDQLVLTPGVILVIVFVLALTFRSVQGVMLPIAAVSVAVAWTACAFAFLGWPVDLIGSIIPTTLLVYGVVDPVFMLTRYLSHIDAGESREDAILKSISELLLPCLLTSTTTALAFAAFAPMSMPTVRHFGIVAAIGVMFAFVTTVTVLPVLLAITATPRKRVSARTTPQLIDQVFSQLWGRIATRRRTVIWAACVMIALGVPAALSRRVSNMYTGLAPASTRASIHLLEDKLSGVVRFSVYLRGEDGSMRRPEVLRAIEAIDKMAQRDPLVTSSVSLADVVGEANQAFNDGDPAFRVIPKSAALIAQYLALIDPTDRSDFVRDDYSRTHIRILTRDEGSIKAAEFQRRLERVIEQQHLERLGLSVATTGIGVLGYRETDRVATEILWGFAYSFAIIVGIEWVAFGSAAIAFASVIPNLVPVAACFIAMWLLGLGLRMDNSLVLCIAIGGLFNTTIQMIARIQQRVRSGAQEPDEVLAHALRSVGPPSLYTAVTLSAGFAVLLASQFAGLRELGLLCAITLLVGFVSDATVTPVLMRSIYRWRVTGPVTRQTSTASHHEEIARSAGGPA
jgi:predicted RND superfamily exporter protein